MKTIILLNEGKYFSGRSHARAIVEKYFLSDNSAAIIDFQGVDSFSQSFISEFFVSLKDNKVDLKTISLKGFKDDVLATRAEKELLRIQSLP